MRAIRALSGAEKVPIVAVTASVFADDRTTLEAAGFSAVLFKPVSIEQLIECLERFLDLRFQSGKDSANTRSADPATAAAAAGRAGPVLETMTELSGLERDGLLQALDTLDPLLINQAIDALAGMHPELVVSLRNVATSYRYSEIRSRLVKSQP